MTKPGGHQGMNTRAFRPVSRVERIEWARHEWRRVVMLAAANPADRALALAVESRHKELESLVALEAAAERARGPGRRNGRARGAARTET